MGKDTSRVTITNVAKAARVSSMTVTRAFQKNSVITEKTRSHVLRIAKELSYYPNLSARVLRGGKTMTVGIIVSNPLNHKLARYISESFMNEGYVSFVADGLGDSDITRTCLRNFYERGTDGVIVQCDKSILDSRILDLLAKIKNVVLFTSQPLALPYDICRISYRKAYQGAIKHLHSRGKKNFVWLGRDTHTVDGNAMAVLKKCAPDGYKYHWDTTHYPSKLFFENYVDVVKDKLTTNKRPDAIFTKNDLAAAQVIAYLITHGIKVPEDIAVYGKGNEPLGQFCVPSLATFDSCTRELADLMFNMLMSRINNPNQSRRKKIIESKFIHRESGG